MTFYRFSNVKSGLTSRHPLEATEKNVSCSFKCSPPYVQKQNKLQYCNHKYTLNLNLFNVHHIISSYWFLLDNSKGERCKYEVIPIWSTNPRPTLGVVTVRVHYIPSGSLMSHRINNCEEFWDGTSGLSSFSKKTRKSNFLQMSLQRKHFLLSYLKTLSVGPAGAWTHDHLPHGSLALYQLSQPVGSLRLVEGLVVIVIGHGKPLYAVNPCISIKI